MFSKALPPAASVVMSMDHRVGEVCFWMGFEERGGEGSGDDDGIKMMRTKKQAKIW